MQWTADDQRRWEMVEALVREKPEVFAVQGTVTSGKYRRLCYREDGVQRSLYLGQSQALADRVEALLRSLQFKEQQRRYMKRLLREARAGLAPRLKQLDAILDQCGIPKTPFDDELDPVWLDRELDGEELLS